MLQNSLQCFKMPQKLFKMLQRFLRHFLNCFRKMPQKWFKMPQNASKFFTMLQKMPLKCLQRSLRHFLNCFRKCDKDKKSIAIGEAFEFQENCEIQDHVNSWSFFSKRFHKGKPRVRNWKLLTCLSNALEMPFKLL